MPKNQTTFSIGQCWISDTELELGVGKVYAVEHRQVTLYFLLADEYRTYSSADAPITRLLFTEGDKLTFLSEDNQKISIQISKLEESNGLIIYTGIDSNNASLTIIESEIQPIVKVNRPVERLFNQQIDQSKWFDLRYQTHQHLNRLQDSQLTGLSGGRLSLIPHQLYIIHEIASRYAPRVLLADEVGLGKTIEAGGILHHQILTGKVKRALIIVPESLVHQWLVEMKRKFNLNFSVYDEPRCQAEEESGLAENPFDGSQLVICSLRFLVEYPERFKQCQQTDWDMLIVDEAHHLQWESQQSSQEYQCIEKLSISIETILLLTATPEQLGKESHFARLRLLDPERYQNYQQFIQEEKSYQPIADTIEHLYQLLDCKPSQISTCLSQEQWQELEKQVDDLALIMELKTNAKSKHQVEAIIEKLSQRLLDYHGTGRVLIRNTRASISGFPKRVPHPLSFKLPAQYIPQSLCPEVEYQTMGDESEHDKQAGEQWLSFDPRVGWLVQFIKESSPKKIVLITSQAQTVKQLHQFLKHKENIVTAVFHEGMTLVERDRAAAFFADEESNCQCILCSEIGSEGRNFQFSSDLILFDLPDNPDLLEQRIGRLDRIGQKNDIQIHLPYFEQSAQEWMYRWYHEGLNALSANCPSAYQVYSQVQSQVLNYRQNPATKDEQTELIAKTCSMKDELNFQLEQGRDKLLEYNSCRLIPANKLIQQVKKNERQNDISPYLEELFDCVGLENEFFKEKSFLLTETDEIQYSFSDIGEQGLVYTCDRETALSNEDMAFFTWEHPLINQLMDKVVSEDLGTTAMVVFSHSDIKPGQLFLEVVYAITINSHLNCVHRVLVDLSGKDLSQRYDHEIFSHDVQNLDKETILGLIEGYSSELREMKKFADKHMQNTFPNLTNAMASRQLNHIQAEKNRLIELKRINPMVHEIEIQRYQELYNELEQQSATAYTSLDAIRVLISS